MKEQATISYHGKSIISCKISCQDTTKLEYSQMVVSSNKMSFPNSIHLAMTVFNPNQAQK